ncbi:MAG: LysR substrate-binding domain-containing protein [Betaproteobacteria bacterium]
MKNATLRQLRAFECVARHLSFSRAATELHLTQPAVSTAIRQLETHAGVPMFEHVGHRIFLTAAGQLVLSSARAIMQQVREAEEALATLGSGGGSLNVAVISAGNYFFPGLLAEFKRSQPNVSITLTVSKRDDVLRGLTDNIIDIAIMGRPPRTADMVSETCAPHPYVMIASPDHPLARKRRIAWARLAQERIIVRERGSDNRQTFEETCGEKKLPLRVAMEIASNETIKQSVISGMGIGFLSQHTIAPELELKRLVMLDIAGFPVMRHWYSVHPRKKRLPPMALAFNEFLRADGAKLIGRLTGIPGKPGRKKARPG